MSAKALPRYCASRAGYARFSGFGRFLYSEICIFAKTASGKARMAFSWCGMDSGRNSVQHAAIFAPGALTATLFCYFWPKTRSKGVFWDRLGWHLGAHGCPWASQMGFWKSLLAPLGHHWTGLESRMASGSQNMGAAFSGSSFVGELLLQLGECRL